MAGAARGSGAELACPGYFYRKAIRSYTARAAMTSKGTQPAAHNTRSLRPTTDGDGLLYGDFIRFRCLEHAPVNELGVIFLFGMICDELGYVVEMVKQGFPDCEAKRQMRPGIWQRVRIEFEFRARKFRTHGHNPEHCDVIVVGKTIGRTALWKCSN
jgi:hypothetical protein